MNKLIILTSHICAGKDYVCKKLEEKGIKRVIGYTTRAMRPLEKQGVEYNFINKDKFFDMDSRNLFVAKRHAFNNTIKDIDYYGVGANTVLTDKYQTIILDPNGATQMAEKIGRENCIIIRLYCDDLVLMERFVQRGDSLKTIEERLKNDSEIFELNKDYDYLINTSYGSDIAVDKIMELINNGN